MDGMTMLGKRRCGTATCELMLCTALPERMHSRTRELVALHVPAEDRRRGYARALLEQVADDADEAGLTLIVIPSPYGDAESMSLAQLAQWYQRRFGFQAIQAKPIIMARLPGSSPKFVTPIAVAARTFIEVERRK